MKEYIEREAAIENAISQMRVSKSELCMRERLMNLPAADVRPVVPGKWTMHSDFQDRLICSECGAQFDCWHWEKEQMHYCPNCGAEMRQKEEADGT